MVELDKEPIEENRAALLVLEGGLCITRLARRQDSDSVQEQGRPQRLQQLQGHLPAERLWQSVCQSHLGPTTGLGSVRVPRLPVRAQSR